MAKLAAELDGAYGTLMKRLGSEKERELLKKSQLAWQDYREAFSSFEAEGYKGGTAMPIVYGGCWISMTKARIKELQELMTQEPWQ